MLYDSAYITQVIKFIGQKVELRFFWGWRSGEWGVNGYRVSVWEGGRVLETDGGDDRTT